MKPFGAFDQNAYIPRLASHSEESGHILAFVVYHQLPKHLARIFLALVLELQVLQPWAAHRSSPGISDANKIRGKMPLHNFPTNKDNIGKISMNYFVSS